MFLRTGFRQVDLVAGQLDTELDWALALQLPCRGDHHPRGWLPLLLLGAPTNFALAQVELL